MKVLRVLSIGIAFGWLVATPMAHSQSVVIPKTGEAPPIFSTKSELVVLQVSVFDSRGRHVGGLGQAAFSISENGESQEIRMFSSENVPATIGLLIDNSASMGPSRNNVIAAALAFAKSSHPDDEVFVLTFNEHVRPAWGPAVVGSSSLATFARDIASAITAAGMTAIYDAVLDGVQRVGRGLHTRRVLVLVSDGTDNASSAKEADVIRSVRGSDATIYAVALADRFTGDGNIKLLRGLTRATGGALFQPQRAQDMPAVLEKIALDIRSAYTLAYAPSRAPSGGRRMIRVQARSPRGKALSVRTRDGYFFKTLAEGLPRE
jgi:VWFA-related protein